MVTTTLDLNFHRHAACRIFFRNGLLERLPHSEFSGASSVAIVSDSNVARLYGSRLKRALPKRVSTCVLTVNPGERSKKLKNVDYLAAELSNLRFNRSSIIIALGGGVVGDLAGFLASIFKRGIKYFQVPTTLLAQVDSSIGGKTGVDTEWGKNQLGTFYQPAAVFIDPSVLDTLPTNEIINGLCEMIKSGIVADKLLFEKIAAVLEINPGLNSVRELKPLILQTCRIKASIVEQDELENGIRSVLNYGHTVGHAIESASDYKLNHGKSVLLGMLCEGWISKQLGIFEKDDFERQEDVLRKLAGKMGVATQIDSQRILSFALQDKKSTSGLIRVSLPEEIGKMFKAKDGGYKVTVPRHLFLASLDRISGKMLC